MAFMLGVFTGAVVLGGLADKVGRKKVFCWSAALQLVLGVGVAFTPNYISFLIVRYVYGIFGSAGSYITGFVLTMELVGPSYRTVCGITFQAVFACGIMLVAGWGALIQDRMILQVVYGLHGALLIAHWYSMDFENELKAIIQYVLLSYFQVDNGRVTALAVDAGPDQRGHRHCGRRAENEQGHASRQTILCVQGKE